MITDVPDCIVVFVVEQLSSRSQERAVPASRVGRLLNYSGKTNIIIRLYLKIDVCIRYFLALSALKRYM